MPASTESLKRRTKSVSSMSLFAVVKAKENRDTFWKEVADVVSFSAGGASLYVPRECAVGTLISVTLPLPAHLRSYDHEKELYKVWGLVQHCQAVAADGAQAYHIGVAFIGKRTPESYRNDPAASYRITGMSEDGLWEVSEAGKPYQKRQDMRYWTAIELYLALVDAKQAAVGGERTITENISRNGAAIICNLDVNVGDRVKFICEEYDFSGLAVVCNRKIGDDKRPRLHLQFVGNSFPVDTIKLTEAEIVE